MNTKTALQLLLILWMPLIAQSATTTDQILEKFIKAHGGRSAFQKLNSRVMDCTLKMDAAGIEMNFEIKSKAPNKRLTKLQIPGFGSMVEGYNGKIAWGMDPTNTVSDKTGFELEKLRRECPFPRELNIKNIYKKIKYAGTEKVNGRKVEVLQLFPAQGSPEKMYFDSESGILLRSDQEAPTPNGQIMTHVYFEDYRDVDGVKIPFKINIKEPAPLKFTLTVNKVTHNIKINDSIFEKP